MELAAKSMTSTTVVREALNTLAGHGLVISRPNRGFFVPELNLRDLRDITELRCETEGLAARLAVERGKSEWEALLVAAHDKLLRIPRRLTDEPELINPAWQAAHRAFHQSLLDGCDCEPIIALAGNLADSTELYRRWAAASPGAYKRDVESEHAAILAAVLDRDAGRLIRLLKNHYWATVDIVLEAGLRSGNTVTSRIDPYFAES